MNGKPRRARELPSTKVTIGFAPIRHLVFLVLLFVPGASSTYACASMLAKQHAPRPKPVVACHAVSATCTCLLARIVNRVVGSHGRAPRASLGVCAPGLPGLRGLPSSRVLDALGASNSTCTINACGPSRRGK